MTAKKPQPAPDQPAMARRPTGPPPPRVQSTTCPTCDAMAAKMRRMESALRVIRTWASCDVDSPHPRCQAMAEIERKCKDALLGR